MLFLVGAVAMRGAGCTYNDIVDRDIDAQVERTRSRPLPSGQVEPAAGAGSSSSLQALVGLVVLLQFNRFTILLGLASLVVVAIYPFMKRVTDWPQFVLGLAFSWGALVGWAAAFGRSRSRPPVLLYAGSVLWTIGYDTIYAQQDKEDDALVGVRSTARLFGDDTKSWLVGLYGGALVLFAGAYAAAEVPMPALAGLLAAGAHMCAAGQRLDIDDPDQCLRLFKSNATVGWLIFLGLVGGGLWVALKPSLVLTPTRLHVSLAGDDLVAADDQAQAEVAGLAARQEARAARLRRAALAAVLRRQRPSRAPSDSSSVRATPSASISSIGSR